MPAARPSQSQISNVIAAILAAGAQPGAIRVERDGSFVVEIVATLSPDNLPSPPNNVCGGTRGPRKFGEARR